MFSPDEVLHLARLSRLELSEAEIERFGRQLGDILAFARQVEAVDTSAVMDALSAPPAPVHLRDDVIQPSLERDDALAPAARTDRDGGLFTVPRVLNG